MALAYWSARKVYPSPVREIERWWSNTHADAERVFRNWKEKERQMRGW